jgi:hypothetical protein
MRSRYLSVAAITLAAVTVALYGAGAQGQLPSPPPGAKAWIVSPSPGEIVQGPDVTVTVESTGIRIPDQGHYHLLVDEAALHYVLGLPIPQGEGYVHFRLPPRATVRLSPGPHVVVLVMGNPAHVPFVPLLSDARYFFVK